jgi:hypothetical protein
MSQAARPGRALRRQLRNGPHGPAMRSIDAAQKSYRLIAIAKDGHSMNQN